MKNKFEFSAIVLSFAELEGALNRKSDCIIHTGVSPCDSVRLKNLAIEHNNNLTTYLDDQDEIYYFRFGKKEHYDHLPLGIPMGELKNKVTRLINPTVYTPEDLMSIYQKGLIELSKIK